MKNKVIKERKNPTPLPAKLHNHMGQQIVPIDYNQQRNIGWKGPA